MKFMKHESLKSKTFPGFGGTAPFGAVWPKIELQGTIFDFRFLFWYFGLMAFGLYVGLCGCGLCLLFCWFADFLVWIFVKTRLRMYVKITSKS